VSCFVVGHIAVPACTRRLAKLVTLPNLTELSVSKTYEKY